MIYAVLSQFETCRNLGVFPLPSTWSSSILPSLPEMHLNPLSPTVAVYNTTDTKHLYIQLLQYTILQIEKPIVGFYSVLYTFI